MEADRSTRLHAEAIVIDGNNISCWDEDTFRNLHQGGVTAINATVCVHENFRRAIEEIARWQRLFEAHASLIIPVRQVDDIRRAKRDGKVGIIMGFQNAAPIEDDLYLLSIFKELGVRIIQLTYNERNYVGDGCRERTDGGLSRFGLEVVEEMNRLGLLIDLSHVGIQTTWDAIETSTRPVAFTHANPRALCDHPRNRSDDQLRAVAGTGGVIGANVHPPFLAAGSRATLDDVVDVIDYLVGLVGIDHVGIGTDFVRGRTKADFDHWLSGKSKRGPVENREFPIINPLGFRSAGEFPNLTAALLARGYATGDVKKIIGENWLRLFGTVWA